MSSLTIALSILAIPLAYLIGSVPFGYLTAYWVKGVDIRTLGSGNVGATNVGRVLGFKFFLLVFVFDVLKGLLPTIGFPLGIQELTGESLPELPVLIALATILGHNFSAFLKFQGGKGVATSLGALLALDPVAIVAAIVGFLFVLVITRYVSMSSILAGICFAVVHFSRVDEPFGREQIALTILTVALLTLLIARHRANLARIAAGTEPKVPLPFGKKRRPEGRAGVVLVLALALAGGAICLGMGYSLLNKETAELDCGPFKLVERSWTSTGHQRANDLTFADEGRLLVVSCPRYNRVVFYRVTDLETLEVLQDVALDGRPMALEATSEQVYVLQRPTGDARHLEEGYWEAFNFLGERIGSKYRIGWDPDDLAVRPEQGLAFVLTSGHAEGETNRPNPALEVIRLGSGTEEHRKIARLEFEGPEDDPERLTLSDSGWQAVVTIKGAEEVACLDLADPEQPTLLARQPMGRLESPYLSRSEAGDRILMPVSSEREAIVLDSLDESRQVWPCLITTLPEGSGLEVIDGQDRRSLGRLPLGGRGPLGGVRPTGLALNPEKGLLAVSDRAGGVHLIAIRDKADKVTKKAVLAAEAGRPAAR